MNDHTRFGATNGLEHVSYQGLECFVTTVYRVQRNDAQVNSVKVLLVDEIAVQRNKDIESRNDHFQQDAILDSRPSFTGNSSGRMRVQIANQATGQAFVQNNLLCDQSKNLVLGSLQCCNHLLPRYGWKIVQKQVDRVACLKAVDQIPKRYACTSKYWHTAQRSGVAHNYTA
jgi:hypothetical protein